MSIPYFFTFVTKYVTFNVKPICTPSYSALLTIVTDLKFMH